MLDIAEADEIAAQLDAAEVPKVASMLDETPMEQQPAKKQWAKRMGVLREQERLLRKQQGELEKEKDKVREPRREVEHLRRRRRRRGGGKRPPTPLRPNARRTCFTVEVGPPHGYEGGGSGRSHPENADPDQQVAKRMKLSTPY